MVFCNTKIVRGFPPDPPFLEDLGNILQEKENHIRLLKAHNVEQAKMIQYQKNLLGEEALKADTKLQSILAQQDILIKKANNFNTSEKFGINGKIGLNTTHGAFQFSGEIGFSNLNINKEVALKALKKVQGPLPLVVTAGSVGAGLGLAAVCSGSEKSPGLNS